jgi:hypothetical protein
MIARCQEGGRTRSTALLALRLLVFVALAPGCERPGTIPAASHGSMGDGPAPPASGPTEAATATPTPTPTAIPASSGDNAAECARLAESAAGRFKEAQKSSKVDACRADADCTRQAFFSERDGCWASCEALFGTEGYADALKGIADGICDPFRAKGCRVFPAGCPMLPRVVRACVSGQCVPATPSQ